MLVIVALKARTSIHTGWVSYQCVQLDVQQLNFLILSFCAYSA